MKRFLSIFILIALIMTAVLTGCDLNDGTEFDENDKSSVASSEGPAPEGTGDNVEESKPSESAGESESDTKAESTPSASEDKTPEKEPEKEPEQEPEKDPVLAEFDVYQSNSITPSGNNYALKSSNGKKTTGTFRGLFKIQEYGELEYKFYFSNNVDSTSIHGTTRNMDTSSYKIVSATVGVVSPMKGSGKIYDEQTVTFDGKETKNVQPAEKYWSDAIIIDVDNGEYLAFEWTVEYTMIPATLSENTISIFDYSSGSIGIATAAPMPDMIGCKRENAVRIGFIGDSITMGVGAGNKNHMFWSAQITEEIGEEYSTWNLGLGYARANDVVNSPAFLEKAKQNDIIVICFGVNDLNSGGRTSTQIRNDIETIAEACREAGAEVILFTTPPYAYAEGKVPAWQQLVTKLKALANDNGYELFDFAAILGDPEDPSKYIYGDHPNQAGCTAVADAFMESGIIEKVVSRIKGE